MDEKSLHSKGGEVKKMKVLRATEKALELAYLLNGQNYRATLRVTPHTEHVSLNVRTEHFTEKQRHLIAEIHKICGVPFTKGRTASNRTTYVGEKDGFIIRCATNIPICEGSTFCKEPKQRFTTRWVCPVGGEEMEK